MDHYPLAIVSYPRSGNTWVRYIVEWLSRRPTREWGDGNDAIPSVLEVAGRGERLTSRCFIARKAHEPPEGWTADGLLAIVRDPDEAIPRHLMSGGRPMDEVMRRRRTRVADGVAQYAAVLRTYVAWPRRKMLLHYEDLVTDPDGSVRRLADLLDQPACEAEAFLHAIDEHRRASVELYDRAEGSWTRGEGLGCARERVDPRHIATIRAMLLKRLTPEERAILDRYPAKDAAPEGGEGPLARLRRALRLRAARDAG